MPTLTGVHLLPSTGEFSYDVIAYEGQRTTETALAPINTYAGQAPLTDYSVSMNQLQIEHPECGTVSIVCSWFCDGITAGSNRIYPSTTYIGGAFQQASGATDDWRCSGLTQVSSGLVSLPLATDGSFVYGGTPSDQSIVRCIRDLKARGLKVIFYPFLLLTAAGLPWRGLITYSPDVSSAATRAIDAFLGAAATSQFTPDFANLTVDYSGSPTDWTYRRMILHYANLCVVAGGVNLFVIGSELRGLETVRGPTWTKAGATDGSGNAIWDYPFVAGMTQLAVDVRGVFDAASLARNVSALENLVTYSADWSVWMGYQHPAENGQWPHLDGLYASNAIDFVSLDNYMPLSDWTTGDGGLDAINWQDPPPASWPVSAPEQRGFALSGPPTIYSSAYLSANIEGGEKFDWYYNNSVNAGAGEDPNGSGLYVSVPEGDRASQMRETYFPGQQILGNKQIRWWWNNPHHALYDTGSGWVAQGPQTEWIPNSKPVLFLEYGIPAVDKGTNQPNLFYSVSSVQSGTPYWSAWASADGGNLTPARDDTIAELALDAIYSYWQTNNASLGGVPMIEWAFCCVWNWDARPFPTFPDLTEIWGDAGNWPYGNWQTGGRTSSPPPPTSPDPTPGVYVTFPSLPTLGWSVHIRPRFSTGVASHASGRETRRPAHAVAVYDVELTYDVLRADLDHGELQTLAAFFNGLSGANEAFWFAPPGLTNVAEQPLGQSDGVTTRFPLVRSFGAYTEPVQATSGVSAVYLDGVSQSSGWSVFDQFFPQIQFGTPPSPGQTISADYSMLWLCRISDDYADFENFMALLWSFRTLKLQTTRP